MDNKKPMDYRDKNTIFQRFNTAAYEIALVKKSDRLGDSQSSTNYKRAAGETLSQTIEWALKHHLNKHLSEREKLHFKSHVQNIGILIEKYINADGSDGDYYYNTVNEDVEPSVNFIFLLKNKGKLTNEAKHEGKEPDFEVQKKYLEEIKKFILEYIDPDIKLKTIEEFERPNTSTWDLLYTACDRFIEEERTLIMVIGPNQNIDDAQLNNLALPKWDLIIDFDYFSESNGFYNKVYNHNELLPHKHKAADFIDTNAFSIYSQTHYHFFANNFQGSGESETKDYNEWNRKKYGKKTELYLKSFSEVFLSQKTIVLFLYDSRRYVNFLCEKIFQYFGDNAVFIFANDPKEELAQVCEDYNGIKIDITLSQIADGLADFSSNFGFKQVNSGKYLIPYMEHSVSKTSGELTPAEFAQYEEYFEVLHKGLPDTTEGEQEKRAFLCGENKISWFGLKYGFDVERPNFNKKYIKQVEKVIESTRGKISLVHTPGYGGTTVARRIAWYFHEDYPTLILKKFRDLKIRELLINLHDKTRKTIFLIMEVPQTITMDEVDSLYKTIPQTRPIVFLIVRRGKAETNDLSLSDWGNDVGVLINRYKPYLNEYTDTIRIKKENEFISLADSIDSNKKTPFFIGLMTFEERFVAIKEYIRKFVSEVIEKEEQKRALTYLTICDDYLGQGLPVSFFKKLFKITQSEVIVFEKYFSNESSIVDSLLSSSQEGNSKFWKIKHNFFSKELKYQLLSGNSENIEIWRQGLPDACVNFIFDSVTDGNISEYTQEVLQKLFIGNRRDRAGTDFTSIINDIDSLDGKERVFLTLKETYPENPHYCSHLARFYAYHNKNREKALQYADEAIRLSEAEGNQDPLLYHIKGMCMRSNVYDIFEKHRNTKQLNLPIDKEAYYDTIDRLVPQAAQQFELSREIAKKQNRVDEYGYIAHIQLLIAAIDYAINLSGKSKAEFFSQNYEPFSEWMDLAESLLEEVKRINLDDDESGKIEECLNKILEFYDNYEMILQNLRSQLDKGKNPSRTRRQIVRTYFRKKENYFRDSKTVNSILSLMEQNIENEPDNEKNFYLWFQAARYSKLSLEDALSKLSKWKANSTAIDAVYYFYILKVFRAMQNYSEATIDALNLIRECSKKGKSNIIIYEWYGKGNDLSKIVNRNEVNSGNKEDKLELVEGVFSEYLHDGSGKITIADKIQVFFSPTQAKLTSSDLNQRVQFYLGFSYDGPRADSYSVRIKGFPPRNMEQIIEPSKKSISTVPVEDNISIEKINQLRVFGKVEIADVRKFSNTKRQKGKITDLQKPPVYKYGFLESEFGKRYLFHSDNEKKEIFNKLSIGTGVTFESKKTDKGYIAFNIELIPE